MSRRLAELARERVPLPPGGFHLVQRARQILQSLHAQLLELLHGALGAPRRARAPDARGVSFLVAAIERETRGGRGLHLGAPAFEAGGRCASLPRHLHAAGPRDRG